MISVNDSDTVKILSAPESYFSRVVIHIIKLFDTNIAIPEAVVDWNCKKIDSDSEKENDRADQKHVRA